MSCQILAHRGNIHGPNPVEENGLATVEAALARGWGLEIDIRRAASGRFYISHDAKVDPAGPWAEDYAAAIRRHPDAVIAVNVKERGDEAALLAFLASEQLHAQSFLFDMELIEPQPGQMARRLRELDGRVRLAARVSDRGESIFRALSIEVASVIWLDEFNGPWSTQADVRRLQAAGRRVYAVSPDLHGGTLDRAQARWVDFGTWGVDGICTDHPEELARVLSGLELGAGV
jgi:hypothetical protein